MKTANFITYPIALLASLMLLAYGAAMQSAPRIAMPAGGAQAVAGQLDPRDLCRAYEAAFTMAGVPNICDAAQSAFRQRMTASNFGVVEFVNPATGETMAAVDWGYDAAKRYYGLLPDEVINSGSRVWTAGIRVYAGYTERGIGSALVENQETLIRMMGARAGDWRLIVAAPARSMTTEAQAGWIDFIARYCASLPGAVALDSMGIGCYVRLR